MNLLEAYEKGEYAYDRAYPCLNCNVVFPTVTDLNIHGERSHPVYISLPRTKNNPANPCLPTRTTGKSGLDNMCYGAPCQPNALADIADIEAARRILGQPRWDPSPSVASWQDRHAKNIADTVLRASGLSDLLDRENPTIGWSTYIGSDSGPDNYAVTVREDTVKGGTYMFCECRAWKFQRGKGNDCKHILRARAEWRRGGPR